MSNVDNIILPQGLSVTSKNYSKNNQEPFIVEIKVFT
jgi:hypothetical protein